MSVNSFLRSSRTLASAAKRRLFPTPEAAAWRKACREADRVPRYTRGSIELLGYDLEYADLLTLCPQWDDLFVREALKAEIDEESPRILDCGANIGLATLYFKKHYPRAKVTAFEADPTICSILEKNLRVNGCADVETVHGAVWTSNGSVSFAREGADSGAIEGVGGALPGLTATVPSVRLKDVLAKGEVSILKLDIEGAEEAVLRDCEDELANVRTLLLDIHEFEPNRRKTPAIFELLANAGFTFTLDELNPLPWREPVAAVESPFPGTHLCWAALIRAWRG